MPDKEHTYNVELVWTGNTGQGAASHTGYSRDHEIRVEGKPPIPGSSDPAFRGDPSRYNPEDMLVGSLAACHMLWYLALCAKYKIVVTQYVDHARGRMVVAPGQPGRFAEAVMRPTVTLAPGSDLRKAEELHEEAHRLCFVANSVNFPVRVEPTFRTAGD